MRHTGKSFSFVLLIPKAWRHARHLGGRSASLWQQSAEHDCYMRLHDVGCKGCCDRGPWKLPMDASITSISCQPPPTTSTCILPNTMSVHGSRKLHVRVVLSTMIVVHMTNPTPTPIIRPGSHRCDFPFQGTCASSSTLLQHCR